jgi:rhomboid protease GluP
VITETDLEFLQSVWSRRPLFTYVFFGINIVVFALMTFAGGTTNETTLIAFGAKANWLIDQGQYWRFLTPVFIHIGILHLFFNSYALWIVGPQVEKLYGNARFVLLFLVTGAAGVAGSYWHRPEGLSAGASGAIFGLFGVLLIFGVRYRHVVPQAFKRAVGTGVLPVILINLVIGFSIPMIDNSAHIAGLLAGMALAAIVPFERPREQTPAVFTALQMGLLALVVLSFFEVGTHYDGPGFAFRNAFNGLGSLMGSSSGTEDFVNAINEAQRSFEESASAIDDSGASQKAVPASAAAFLAKAIDDLKKAPSLSTKADELTTRFLSLLQDQYDLLQDIERSGTVTLMQARRASENTRKYEEVVESFSSWVNAEGKRYGIQLRKPR